MEADTLKTADQYFQNARSFFKKAFTNVSANIEHRDVAQGLYALTEGLERLSKGLNKKMNVIQAQLEEISKKR
jgi:hypothetical protein